jgi:predicted ATP-grasp superfamily ATP-dependent carboligase
MPRTIFVTDGNERSALAIVRALGRRGLSVIVGDDRSLNLASASKYCARRVVYPSPARDRAAFDRFLIHFLASEKIDAVIPVTDVTTHAMCARQDVIHQYAASALPPFEAFDFVSDKRALVNEALRCDIRVPRTVVIDTPERLSEIVKEVHYPAVVKPSRSRIPFERGWLHTRVHYAHSERELIELYRTIPYLALQPSLIQERIVGPGLGVFVLFDRGRLVAQFGHRRLREQPPAGGVSVLRESITPDVRLTDQARRLLGAAKWHGVAMLEYKQDRATGDLFLMEVNGRFWGSLQLAIDSGVDFPHLWCELAFGRVPDAPPSYRVGVRSRWLMGDVDHLLLRLFKRSSDLHLPPGTPGRLRTIAAFARFRERDLYYEIESVDDPGPWLYEFRQTARSLSASAARAARLRPGRRAPVRAPAITPVQ